MIYCDFERKKANSQVLLLKCRQFDKQLQVDFSAEKPYDSGIS